MKKDQIQLLIGISAPLLLVAVLLIQLHQGQMNLTRAILHLSPRQPVESLPADPLANSSPEIPPLAPTSAESTQEPAQEKPETPADAEAVASTAPADLSSPPAVTPESIGKTRPLPGELKEVAPTDEQRPTQLTYQPVTINHFYPLLQRYGRWLVHPIHGNVWMPHSSRRDRAWRPYGTNGRWYYTHNGWHWQSDYKWGGTTFHYGRWYWDTEETAWVWVPGREYSPAWVSWRETEKHVGWAPLPPLASISQSPTPSSRPTGTSGIHIDYALNNNHFTFVPKADLLAEVPLEFALTGDEAILSFGQSRQRNRIALNAQRQWTNFGIAQQEIARAIGSPIEVVMVDLRNPYHPEIVTQADLEAARKQAEEAAQETASETSTTETLLNNQVSRSDWRAPIGYRSTRWQGAGSGVGGVVNPSPIVIDENSKTTNSRSAAQPTNAGGQGIRRGQPRPNLSTRQAPSGN